VRIYRVYVIEVIPPSRESYLYVGQTVLTPMERLYQHAGGKKYCRLCTNRRYIKNVQGTKLRLRSDLAGLIGRGRFATRSEAERAERWLGRELRGMGYVIRGGH
jgi:hypothetical protein